MNANAVVNVSDTDSSEGESSKTKKRKIQNSSFKESVLEILQKVTDFAPGEFVVSGRFDAPTISISIKVI